MDRKQLRKKDKYDINKLEALIAKYTDVSMTHNMVDVNIVRQLDSETLEAIRKYILVKLEEKLNENNL